jgi:hypothetical protein
MDPVSKTWPIFDQALVTEISLPYKARELLWREEARAEGV